MMVRDTVTRQMNAANSEVPLTSVLSSRAMDKNCKKQAWDSLTHIASHVLSPAGDVASRQAQSSHQQQKGIIP